MPTFDHAFDHPFFIGFQRDPQHFGNLQPRQNDPWTVVDYNGYETFPELQPVTRGEVARRTTLNAEDIERLYDIAQERIYNTAHQRALNRERERYLQAFTTLEKDLTSLHEETMVTAKVLKNSYSLDGEDDNFSLQYDEERKCFWLFLNDQNIPVTLDQAKKLKEFINEKVQS